MLKAPILSPGSLWRKWIHLDDYKRGMGYHRSRVQKHGHLNHPQCSLISFHQLTTQEPRSSCLEMKQTLKSLQNWQLEVTPHPS